ncbi:MAG TPA: Na+/H+ antiporter NhaA [Steroidobacter sp.]
MNRHPQRSSLPPAHLVAQRVFSAIERFLHVEAVSGIVLLVAAATALVWANSPASASYHHLWHAPLTVGFGGLVLSQPLEFWINDGLMTVFFLVVGLEIRREMHEGALSRVRQATLPLAAALGGVLVPALIYLSINAAPGLRDGWAIPTATDIAFAVGVLALLGKAVPPSVRILLLALAVIDDIAAVVVIALFYSAGFSVDGLLISLGGALLVLALQHLGVGAALAYVVPGAIVWFGLLRAGVHPTLAGVILGLLTPTRALDASEGFFSLATRALDDFRERTRSGQRDPSELREPLKELRVAQRELLPPAVRVQMALHPWVAYGVMPLFALANAGITLEDINISDAAARSVAFGVFIALVVGKPLGIFLATWLVVRSDVCGLPADVTWRSVALVGCLGGIGFTMSIFIATLAFGGEGLLGAAKLGVLVASATAAVVGLAFGKAVLRRRTG